MSVHKLRKSFDNKGCQVALWIIMVGSAVALAGSGFFACFNPSALEQTNVNVDIDVLSIDGRVVSYYDVLTTQDVLRPSFSNFYEPQTEFNLIAITLLSVVTDDVIAQLAQQKGVRVDEGTALALAGQEVDNFIAGIRQQAVAFEMIPNDGVESDFQDYFTEQFGVGTREYKDREIENTQELLKDELASKQLLTRYSRNALMQSFIATTTVTDDEIESSFEQYEVLSVRFNDQDLTLKEREAQAKEALAELEGGASFLVVMLKYDKNPNIQSRVYSRISIEAQENLLPILELEDGQHSEVSYEFVGSPVIYQLVSLKKDLPEDFEDNKEFYKSQPRQQKGQVAFEKAIEEGVKSSTIKWFSPGYKVVYELAATLRNLDISEADLKAYLHDFVDTVKPDTTDLAGPRPAINARYIAMWTLNDIATDVNERNELAEKYAQVIQEFLVLSKNVKVSLELVEVYERLDDMESATATLLLAAKDNIQFQPENSTYNDEISRMTGRYQAEEKISEDVYAEIMELVKEWGQNNAAYEKDIADQRSDIGKYTIDPATGRLLTDIAKDEDEEEEAGDDGEGGDDDEEEASDETAGSGDSEDE